MYRLSRVGTINNLEEGGTYDLLFLSFPDGYPESALKFAMGDVPRKTTGVQKVAQVFLYALLTTQGVDPIRPQAGTGFLEYVKSSNRTSDAQEARANIQEFINDAKIQAQYTLNREGSDTSSMLRSVDIIKIVVDGEYTNIILRLVTYAGEKAAIAIPFPQLDLKLNDR